MKIAVTGGAGYIGSCLVQELLDCGHHVLVIDDLSTGFVEAIPSEARFEKVNILDVISLRKVFEKFRPNALFHLAAKTKVEESLQMPELYYEVNAIGSFNVAKVAADIGINSVIFSSTAAVYGDVNVEVVSENEPLKPINPYGRSKLMAENIFLDLSASKSFSVSILRYFNVAGAKTDLIYGNRNPRPTQVIEVAALSALESKAFTIFGTNYNTPDGSAVRDFIHIEDLVSAHVLALEDLEKFPGRRVFNCGYGKGFSVLEVAHKMSQLTDGKMPLIMGERRAGDPSCVIADPTRIKEVLHWRPRFDQLDIICSSTLNFKRHLSSALLKDDHR